LSESRSVGKAREKRKAIFLFPIEAHALVASVTRPFGQDSNLGTHNPEKRSATEFSPFAELRLFTSKSLQRDRPPRNEKGAAQEKHGASTNKDGTRRWRPTEDVDPAIDRAADGEGNRRRDRQHDLKNNREPSSRPRPRRLDSSRHGRMLSRRAPTRRNLQKRRAMGSDTEEIEISINRQLFRIGRRPMTGAELRHLSMPPIGPDQDLFQVSSRGEGNDILVTDSQIVDFDTGVAFFSTPRMILAGAKVDRAVFRDDDLPGSGSRRQVTSESHHSRKRP
jgi:hypothetical protein